MGVAAWVAQAQSKSQSESSWWSLSLAPCGIAAVPQDAPPPAYAAALHTLAPLGLQDDAWIETGRRSSGERPQKPSP
jgi:hypothetical protein